MFEGTNPPKAASYFGKVIFLKSYVQKVRRCDNCQRYGHPATQCRGGAGARVCSKCASHDHDRKACKALSSSCVNCIRYNNTKTRSVPFLTSHAATSDTCPVYIENKRIKIIMAKLGIGPKDAFRFLSKYSAQLNDEWFHIQYDYSYGTPTYDFSHADVTKYSSPSSFDFTPPSSLHVPTSPAGFHFRIDDFSHLRTPAARRTSRRDPPSTPSSRSSPLSSSPSLALAFSPPFFLSPLPLLSRSPLPLPSSYHIPPPPRSKGRDSRPPGDSSLPLSPPPSPIIPSPSVHHSSLSPPLSNHSSLALNTGSSSSSSPLSSTIQITALLQHLYTVVDNLHALHDQTHDPSTDYALFEQRFNDVKATALNLLTSPPATTSLTPPSLS